MNLWRPFAALGLAGGAVLCGIHQAGWLLLPSSMQSAGNGYGIGAALLGLVPVSLLCLGVLVEPRLGHRWLRTLSGWTLAIGALTGALACAFLAGPIYALSGAWYGLAYAVPFVLLTAPMAFAAWLVRARADTPAGRAERRGPWIATSLSVAVGAAVIHAWVRPLGDLTLALAGLASGVATLVLVNDLAELIPLNRLTSYVTNAQRRTISMPLADVGARFYDLGVGDAHFDEIVAGEPYRGADRLIRTIHGDPKASLRALTNAIVRDVAVLLACAGIFASLASY